MEQIKLPYGLGKSITTLMFKRPIFFVCKEYIQIRKRVAAQQEVYKEKEQTGHPVLINKKKAVS